ncbi:YL1-domain-containing protein [Rhizodiscina lignyota]|uniref:YL1-domain-containing protein n=1 Tax=Rhizodiscina lignyota TaxID=1504668 RepID=A0A9P4IJU0_9PEZI|nr:YL1-domain-containing protein [Rhizodiscina lignyota]
MADAAGDTEMDTTPQVEEEVVAEDAATEEGREGSDGESVEEPEEPSMVVTRERRSNAGRNLQKLLLQAAAEDEEKDEIAEIFQETADDEEFSGTEAEDAGDVSLESSSDEDEDNEGEEDQGEKELKKQERSDQRSKGKKRKTMAMMYKPRPLKRPRIEVSVSDNTPRDSTEPTARPKKKSERVSWIPTPEEGPTRMSQRRLAVENKARTHERLKEKEQHRLRTLAVMKAADQRKEANKPKALTQEDRLREAAKIEAKNSKTLTRWEESERKKEQERKEREAAGRKHNIDGPFVRYYSGPGFWFGDKLFKDGYKLAFRDRKVEEVEEEAEEEKEPASFVEKLQVVEEGYNKKEQKKFLLARKKEEKERKEREEAAAAAAAAPVNEPPIAKPGEVLAQTPAPPAAPATTATPQVSQPPQSAIDPNLPPTYPNSIMFPPPQAPGLLDGIHYWASLPGDKLPEETNSSINGQPPQPQSFAHPTGPVVDPSFFNPLETAPASAPAPLSKPAPQPAPAFPPALFPEPVPAPPPMEPPPYLHASLAMRTLIHLEAFDTIAHPDAEAPTTTRTRKKDAEANNVLNVLLPHNIHAAPGVVVRSKYAAVRTPQVCEITSRPARYRDPATGLAYADGYAYKCIQRLVKGGCQWSGLLGCFVGTVGEPMFGRAAVGVPDVFVRRTEENSNAL